MTQFEVPKGLADMLQSFTVSVLREKPPDIYQFAADYFQRVNEERKNAGVVMESPKKGVSFGVPMQTDSSDDEPIEEPPKNNRLQRRKSVSAERYDPEADDDDEPKVVHPKSDDQRQRLNEATKGILLFRSLDIEQMQDVIDAMFEVKVAPNDHVIDQGDDGDNFYVIDSGTYDIYVEGANENKPVGSYKDTGSFGELALMYNMPRAATIVATSPGSLWAMDRSTFRRIVLKNAFNKRKMYESLLETVPMLSTLTPYERMNIADALVTKQYNDGELIIRQGDSADCMYIIEDGEVKICMKLEGRETETVISTCTKGNYFGELALLTHKPRAASAYAVGPVRLAVLDVEAFERLLGPCYEIMKRTMKDYEDQLIQLFGDSANITDLR